MIPWRDWYHVTGNTYASWLPGDPRGWKTRHARTQPGADAPVADPPSDRLLKHVRARLRRDPVTLTPTARQRACEAILLALHFHSIEVVAIAVAPTHFHLLARFPDRRPRHWVGIAKKESARALSREALVAPGGVWAVRTHGKPITDRPHQVQVARYILDHAAQGAAIWRCDSVR